MASPKVMMRSRSPPNQDLSHHSSPSPLNLHSDQSRGFGSMNMEEMLRNIYSDSDRNGVGEGSSAAEASEGVGNGYGNKTMDETWMDIVSGEQGMTLEDYLAKEGVVVDEDVRALAAMDQSVMMSPEDGVPMVQFGAVQNGGFGNGMVVVSGGRGRGKRKAVEEVQVDKVTQQKQRRMIKNRESAARSRERKQAYTVELESIVLQLEEENARLLKEEAELNKERCKQLMENLIPVVEKQRTPRILRRTHSMQW